MRVANVELPGFDPVRLRQLLGDRSPVDVAKAIGVSRVAVHRYLSGGRTPAVQVLARLAAELGRAPLEFFDTDVVGRGLLALRVTAGLTQATVAAKASPDLTVDRYQRLEAGQTRQIREADIVELAAVFGVTEDEVRRAHRWACDHSASDREAVDSGAHRDLAGPRSRRPRLG